MPALLSSATEYFDALCNGKFLLFLDFPVFLGLQKVGADSVVDDLAIAWLEHGLNNEQCSKMFYLLYAASQEEDTPLTAYPFYYCLILINSGFLIAQTIRKLGFDNEVLAVKASGEDAKKFIADRANTQEFTDALAALNTEYNPLSDNQLKKAVANTLLKIKGITDLLVHINGYVNYLDVKVNGEMQNQIKVGIDVDSLLMDYIKKLEWLNQGKKGLNEPIDPLLHTRLCWVLKLSNYLRSQVALDKKVQFCVAEFVNEIRSYHPPAEEEQLFLSKISSLSTRAVVMKTMMRSLGFFGDYEAVITEGKSASQSQEADISDAGEYTS